MTLPPTTPAPAFVDVTAQCGLPLVNAARLTFVDLDGDGRADVVLREGNQFRAFMNRPGGEAGFHFEEVPRPGLPIPNGGDLLVLADLDNDGHPDAIFTHYQDVQGAHYAAPTTLRAAAYWLPGRGDGTFGMAQAIVAARAGTIAAVAVGDADGDGLPDLALAKWYDHYDAALTAYPTDLLLQRRGPGGEITFERRDLPEEGVPFDEERDAGPRPIYGALFLRRDAAEPLPSLLQVAYGRRWNRLYVPVDGKYIDRAAEAGVDADEVRHGRYPAWLKEVARTDKRFDREDEKPFRSGGNNFDAAVGDVDGDGRLDLILTCITHAWAGESSDRTRILLQGEGGRFRYDPRLSLDRRGTPATTRASWNQGDLFALPADFNLDGRMDVLLASSEYPDPPPHENKLRLYLQQADGTLVDTDLGIAHLGAQQISLADVDGDGAPDVLVGQSFNRFPPRTPGPTARLYLNRTAGAGPHALTLRLVGNPALGVPRTPFAAIVRCTATIGGRPVTQVRELMGPGGHNGKGGDLAVHVGLGDAAVADRVEVLWPGGKAKATVLERVPAGTHIVRLEGP